MKLHNNVVFYDGVCVFCNSSVRLLIRLDRKQKLNYSTLQGEFAQQILGSQIIADLSGVVFWSDGQAFHKSKAALRILIKLGGVYKALGIALNLLPYRLLNIFYSTFAKYRYRLFGKHERCPLPSPEEQELFIP